MIDRYTYYVLQFLEGVTPNSKATVGELVSSLKLEGSIEIYFFSNNYSVLFSLCWVIYFT